MLERFWWSLAFENANTECQKLIRPLKGQGASLEERIRAVADNGSAAYNANIIGQALAKGLQSHNTGCFNYGKVGHLKKELSVNNVKKKCFS